MVDFLHKAAIKMKRHLRLCVQVCFVVLTNGYAAGFVQGKIYTGATKVLCLPGLNCYSCPGALGACPIGALQAVLGARQYRTTLYVAGFLFVFGALMGRFICGWLCPFGLVQDLLHKIPLPKLLRQKCGLQKKKRLPGHRILRVFPYVVLLVLVILLPLFALDAYGVSKPWFCAYLCPSGTLLAGMPLVLANEGMRASLGWLFTWKTTVLVVLLLLSVLVYRPFCQYLCPLGAVYGWFNRISLYRFRVDKARCTRCGACKRACPVDIPTWQTPNAAACIRCGKCKQACPHGALTDTFPRSSFLVGHTAAEYDERGQHNDAL